MRYEISINISRTMLALGFYMFSLLFLFGCATRPETVVIEDVVAEYVGRIAKKDVVSRDEVIYMVTREDQADRELALLTILSAWVLPINMPGNPEATTEATKTAFKYTVETPNGMAIEVYSHHSGFSLGDCVRVFKGETTARMTYGSGCE